MITHIIFSDWVFPKIRVTIHPRLPAYVCDLPPWPSPAHRRPAPAAPTPPVYVLPASTRVSNVNVWTGNVNFWNTEISGYHRYAVAQSTSISYVHSCAHEYTRCLTTMAAMRNISLNCAAWRSNLHHATPHIHDNSKIVFNLVKKARECLNITRN